MENQNYHFQFTTKRSPEEVFSRLLDPKKWWVGIFGESIEGHSDNIDDEFTFKAGEGMHFTRQQLIEKNPYNRIVWSVRESQLSFLNNPEEWLGTQLSFDISKEGDTTTVTFTHIGLVPEIECYSTCSGGWDQYLDNLKKQLS